MVDVVVIGGGVAGITAAVGCAQAGLKVVLLEKSVRLGGRAESWPCPKTGDPIHIGPHIFYKPDYVNCEKLMDVVGTGDKTIWQPDGHFLTYVTGDKKHHMSQHHWMGPPTSFLPSMLRDPAMNFWDVVSLVRPMCAAFSLSNEELLAIDNESGLEWFRRHGASENVIDHFFAFAAESIINVPIAEVSATSLVRFVRRLAGTSRTAFGFPDCGLGDCYAPAEGLLTRLGSSVRLATEVKTIVAGPEGEAKSVLLTSGELITPRLGVVATLPADRMGSILPDAWLQQAPELAKLQMLLPCAYFCTYLWFDRKVTDMQFWARTRPDPGSLNCDFYDFSNIYSKFKGKDQASQIGSNTIDISVRADLRDLKDEEIVAATLKELYENIPEAQTAKLTHSYVSRVPCAVPRLSVGMETLRPPPGRSQSIKGLYLAGDWTQTDFFCCMESSAHAGWRAAEHVIEADRGKAPELVVERPGLAPLPLVAGAAYRMLMKGLRFL